MEYRSEFAEYPRVNHRVSAPDEEIEAGDLTEPEGHPSLGRARLLSRVRAFLDEHGRKLWWMHSLYAMCLGGFVVMFAQKGFAYARWLTLMLLAVWFIIVLLFRLFGSGRRQTIATPQARVRFLVMTYVLKNLYQGMLFFLLPFYWKTATFDAGNRWFLLLLVVCAVMATLDLVFDRVLMRWRLFASIYYAVTLFAALNLAIPALYPTPALVSLLIAAFFATVAFWTLHFRLRALVTPPLVYVMVASLALSLGTAYAARRLVPPVPLQLVRGAVGTEELPDGRLALEVTRVHASLVDELLSVTDVFTPVGEGEAFMHVWRLDGDVVARVKPTVKRVGGKRRGAIRLRSELRREKLPVERAGSWSVDIETAGGQLVGRYDFEVTE